MQANSTFEAHSDPIVDARQSRRRVIEDELVRLSNLAAGKEDRDQQDAHWELAQQLQRDAREIRAEIHLAYKVSEFYVGG